jgi:hypothetical protein
MNIKQKGDRFELKIDRTKLTSADLGKLRLIISIDLTNKESGNKKILKHHIDINVIE